VSTSVVEVKKERKEIAGTGIYVCVLELSGKIFTLVIVVPALLPEMCVVGAVGRC
jgi:hypothetical protein